MTGAVGPSVVKTQKSSDKFCGSGSKSKRKKERRTNSQVVFPPTLLSPEPPTYQGDTMCSVDHQPGVNLINHVNPPDQTLSAPNRTFIEELRVSLSHLVPLLLD